MNCVVQLVNIVLVFLVMVCRRVVRPGPSNKKNKNIIMNLDNRYRFVVAGLITAG